MLGIMSSDTEGLGKCIINKLTAIVHMSLFILLHDVFMAVRKLMSQEIIC